MSESASDVARGLIGDVGRGPALAHLSGRLLVARAGELWPILKLIAAAMVASG